MKFDWPRFLSQNRVPFVTRGPNVGKNNVNIKCPMCGDNDPSEHMGLNQNGFWGCLRNQAHRGKSPIRLIRALLNCSEEEARRLAGLKEAAAVTQNDLEASRDALRATMGQTSPKPSSAPLAFPSEFKPLLNGSPFATPFLAYLADRGYRPAQVKWLADNYKLHYATRGLYAGRIIIPIFDRYGDILSWTARTINSDVQPRYRTLRMYSDDGSPCAKVPANGTLLGLPVLWRVENPRALILVEGPFDALKVTAFGSALGVYATCVFGLNVYPSQLAELQELSSRFGQLYLLIDEDARFQRLRLLEALRPARVKALSMPPGSDDPGALSAKQVTEICLGLLA